MPKSHLMHNIVSLIFISEPAIIKHCHVIAVSQKNPLAAVNEQLIRASCNGTTGMAIAVFR